MSSPKEKLMMISGLYPMILASISRLVVISYSLLAYGSAAGLDTCFSPVMAKLPG